METQQANYMNEHYGLLNIVLDVLKTTLCVKVVESVASLDLPVYMHEWLSCGIGFLAFIHILQKIVKEHKKK